MFSLQHITVKQFFELEEEDATRYVELQSIMKSRPVFLKRRAKNLGGLTYGEVAELKRYISNPSFENMLESFKIVFGVKQIPFLTADVVSFFYALNWIVQSVKQIIEKEKVLVSDPDPELEAAGVKRLAPFGELATLINLGESFGKAPTDIEKWKYNLVFTILYYNKIKAEVQKEYIRIKYPKRGGKR